MQMVKDNLLNLLLNLLGLAQNDIALALNGGLLELGVLQDIGQDIDALRNIGVEGLGEVNGVLALGNVCVRSPSCRLPPSREPGDLMLMAHRGVGVQVTTHVLNFKF